MPRIRETEKAKIPPLDFGEGVLALFRRIIHDSPAGFQALDSKGNDTITPPLTGLLKKTLKG